MNVINNDLFYFLYVRRYLLLDGVRRLIVLSCCFQVLLQSSADVWKSRWPSWAPVPNKPRVSLDVKQHSTNSTKFYARRAVRASRPGHARIICSGQRRCASTRFGRQRGVLWARDTTLQGLPTRCGLKRSGRASRLQSNRQAKLPVCAVPWPAVECFIHLHRHSIYNFSPVTIHSPASRPTRCVCACVCVCVCVCVLLVYRTRVMYKALRREYGLWLCVCIYFEW